MHWAGLWCLIFSRYFNAWVESGHLHIQTEFCEGGSLEAKVGLDPLLHIKLHLSSRNSNLRQDLILLLITHPTIIIFINTTKSLKVLKVDVCIKSAMKFSDLELRKILIQVQFFCLCCHFYHCTRFGIEMEMVCAYPNLGFVVRWPGVCSTCTRRSWPTWTSSRPTSSLHSASLRTLLPRLLPPSLDHATHSGFLLTLVQVLLRKLFVKF